MFEGMFFSQMGNTLGVCETMYEVKHKEKVLLGEIWLASKNVRTRVSLLYIVRELLNCLRGDVTKKKWENLGQIPN